MRQRTYGGVRGLAREGYPTRYSHSFKIFSLCLIAAERRGITPLCD